MSTQRTTAQVWVYPAVPLQQAIQFGTTGHIEMLAVESPIGPNASPMQLTLLQCECDDDGDCCHTAFRDIGRVLDWIRFMTQKQFQVLCARLLPVEAREGSTVESVDFPGEPPGLSNYEYRVGYGCQGTLFFPGNLNAILDDDAGRSIEWYVNACRSQVAAERIASFWIALEALVPETKKPLECPKCREKLGPCSHCGNDEQYVVLAAIRALLVEEWGLCSKRELSDLYELRSRIVHGDRSVVAQDISKAAFSTQALVVSAIKRRLGLGVNDRPVLIPSGMTIKGVPGVSFSFSFASSDRNQPGCRPLLPWETHGSH